MAFSFFAVHFLLLVVQLVVAPGKVKLPREEFTLLPETDFDAGDLIDTKDGLLMFALDTRTLVYLDVHRTYTTFRKIDKIIHSDNWQNRLLKTRRESFPFGETKGIAVAASLVNRKVPYGWWGCNQQHYMDYFTLGYVKRRASFTCGLMNASCPLTRKLNNVPHSEITSNEFYLQSRDGGYVYPARLGFAPADLEQLLREQIL